MGASPAGGSEEGEEGVKIPQDVIDAAVQAHKSTGVPASVTIAQWALESDYGRHMPAGSHNPFGIKAGEGQPFVESRTHEFLAGRWIGVTARFRRFSSLSQAFQAHGELIANGRPYRRIHDLLGDPEKLAHALTGLYATDPNYGHELVQVMNEHDLWKYDRV